MDYNYLYKRLFLSGFFLLCASILFAQQTVVSGTVTDAGNKKPLPFVTVSFTGTTIGINTDNAGHFTLTSSKPVSQLKVAFLGYKDAILPVTANTTQVINVRLFPAAQQLNEVVVKSGKKPKYRNKDNPAVELIRQVIANKEKNRPEHYDYVEYKEYDKMQFSVLNVSDKLAEKKFFRKYKFVLDNRDSTTVPGKNLLPIFLDEKLSQYYYRKSPEKEKTVVLGQILRQIQVSAFTKICN